MGQKTVQTVRIVSCMTKAYNASNQKMLLRDIGNRLRDIRQRQGMTQANLAEKAELSTVYISQIESGQKNISVDVLVRLCCALNISSDDLLHPGFARRDDLAYGIGTMLADCTEEECTAVLHLLQDIKSLMDLVKTATQIKNRDAD